VQCGGSGDGEGSGNSIGSGVSDATIALQEERERSNNHTEEEKIKCDNQPLVTKATQPTTDHAHNGNDRKSDIPQHG